MSIQGNINQLLGTAAFGARFFTNQSLRSKKQKIADEKAATKLAEAEIEANKTEAEKWVENLDVASRTLYERLGPAAKQQILEQASGGVARKEMANAQAMARVNEKKQQKQAMTSKLDNYVKFMKALREERNNGNNG